jgi:hypothetical protein
MNTITLTNPVNYIVRPAGKKPQLTALLTTITPLEINDDGVNNVFVLVNEIPRPILCWTGEGYVAAGDYTQANLLAKLVKVIEGTSQPNVL